MPTYLGDRVIQAIGRWPTQKPPLRLLLAGCALDEFGVLRVGRLVLRDPIDVRHRAEAALRLRISGVPRISHRHPLDRSRLRRSSGQAEGEGETGEASQGPCCSLS